MRRDPATEGPFAWKDNSRRDCGKPPHRLLATQVADQVVNEALQAGDFALERIDPALQLGVRFAELSDGRDIRLPLGGSRSARSRRRNGGTG